MYDLATIQAMDRQAERDYVVSNGARHMPSKARVYDGSKGDSFFGKRHYNAIAKVISPYFESQSLYWTVTPAVIAQALADLFEKDNPKFDRVQFYEAAGATQKRTTS